nr:hypothetical protein [Streptomyces sp. LS1784]
MPQLNDFATTLFFPRRLNSVSSTVTVSTAPSDSRRRTTRWDRAMPRRSGFQVTREKKAWARSWDQVRVNPAPRSIPVTVHRPVCAISPVTSAAKVWKVGAVKQPRTNSNTASSEAGTVGSGSIGGSLTADDASTADASPLSPAKAAR